MQISQLHMRMHVHSCGLTTSRLDQDDTGGVGLLAEKTIGIDLAPWVVEDRSQLWNYFKREPLPGDV